MGIRKHDLTPESLCGYIDHTYLKPDATHDDIVGICNDAVRFGFKSVCVNLSRLPIAESILRGKKPIPIVVVGFPLGSTSTSIKKAEALEAIEGGAGEIDMVISVGALKDRNNKIVLKDIQSVVQACGNIPVKVIIEACLLNKDEKITACKISVDAGASFVKTSTGFSNGGATVDDIMLMRKTVGPDFGVKASGGIKTFEDAIRLIGAGATRLGTSASVSIVSGGKKDKNEGY